MYELAPDIASGLTRRAKKVLERNDRGSFTVPSEGLYPHQVLWDSCFVAIGYSHYDIERAQTEILSLLSAQWSNGMVPHIVFSKGYHYWWDRRIWRSRISPLAPTAAATSGISQPPMLAEAVVRIGGRLDSRRRHEWYGSVLPSLLAYHQWFYRERRVDDSGLVAQFHPWETGLDNTPPAIAELHSSKWPWWLKSLERTRLDLIASRLRFDTRYVPASQRSSNIEALALYNLLRGLRHDRYEAAGPAHSPQFVIEDVVFNSILVRANELLAQIAREIGHELPADLQAHMRLNAEALDSLWHDETGLYYSRSPSTGQLVSEPTVGAFLPLYAGSISPGRAKHLAKLMDSKDTFGTDYPLPSVPLNSHWFKPKRYWQGPTWVNINWLIIDGLRRYGLHAAADRLAKSTLAMVGKSGFYEYFDPRSGDGAGTDNFSWTAALTIDLCSR